MPKEPKPAKQPKQKARISTKLKQKVSKTKSHNLSEDLTKLTEAYNAFCTRLQGLVGVRRRCINIVTGFCAILLLSYDTVLYLYCTRFSNLFSSSSFALFLNLHIFDCQQPWFVLQYIHPTCTKSTITSHTHTHKITGVDEPTRGDASLGQGKTTGSPTGRRPIERHGSV